MRFGERIEEERERIEDLELQHNVLAYNQLKGQLEQCVAEWEKGGGNAEEDRDTDNSFWQELTKELAKLDAFYDKRCKELKERTGKASSATHEELEQLHKDLGAMRRWVDLNHVGLVKIHKKYVKNAVRSTGGEAHRWGSRLPTVFSRPLFEDTTVSKLLNVVRAFSQGSQRCTLCRENPCKDPDGCGARRREVLGYCRECVEGWEGKGDDELVVRVLTGGLSNLLYTVECCDRSDTRRVVVRIFGVELNRSTDNYVSKTMAELGVGPKIHGVFDTARVEQFIDGMALRFYHLSKPSIVEQVASLIARFHKLPLPDGTSRSPRLIADLRSLHKEASAVSFTEGGETADGTPKADVLAAMEIDGLSAEIDWLEEKVKGLPVAFCHCDVQEGNLLADNTTEKITLIDYEYAGCDYAAYDLGNYLCEAYIDNFYPVDPGFKCHPSLFPSDGVQTSLVQNYLKASFGRDPTDTEVEEWKSASLTMTLASHLRWALWGVPQAATSEISGFCFLTYSAERLGEYRRLKRVLYSKQ